MRMNFATSRKLMGRVSPLAFFKSVFPLNPDSFRRTAEMLSSVVALCSSEMTTPSLEVTDY